MKFRSMTGSPHFMQSLFNKVSMKVLRRHWHLPSFREMGITYATNQKVDAQASRDKPLWASWTAC